MCPDDHRICSSCEAKVSKSQIQSAQRSIRAAIMNHHSDIQNNNQEEPTKHQEDTGEIAQEKKRPRIDKDEASQVDQSQSIAQDMLQSKTAEPATAVPRNNSILDLAPAPVMAQHQQRQLDTSSEGKLPTAGTSAHESTSLVTRTSQEGSTASATSQQDHLSALQQQLGFAVNASTASTAPFLHAGAQMPTYQPFLLPHGMIMPHPQSQQPGTSSTTDTAATSTTASQQQMTSSAPATASAPPPAMLPYPFQVAPTESGGFQYSLVPPNPINATAAHLMAMAAAAGISQQQQAMSMFLSSTQQHQSSLAPAGAPGASMQQPQVQQHLAAVAGLAGINTGPARRGPLLYIPTDDDVLSENQILLRQQVEFFEAALGDVGKTTSGRRRPIMLNQVGIQCRHCGGVPARYRQKGAIYYPARLSGIYQAAQNMAVTHLTNLCDHIDESTKEQLKSYQLGRSVTGHGGKRYWAGTAKAQGIVEAEEGGLRFNTTPVAMPTVVMQQHYPSMTAGTWQQQQQPPSNAPAPVTTWQAAPQPPPPSSAAPAHADASTWQQDPQPPANPPPT